MPKPLIIEAPRQGISASPHTGYGDVRNLDIFSIPGVARLNNVLTSVAASIIKTLILKFVKNPLNSSQIFGVDRWGVVYQSTNSGSTWAILAGKTFTVTIASPAVFTCTAHGLVAGDYVMVDTTGTLPTGLTAGNRYYVIAAGLTADAFELSATLGGAAINTSGSQSGTHNVKEMSSGAGFLGGVLSLWKDYLIQARETKLDVYGPLSSSPAWTYNWKTIDSDTIYHPLFVSKNDSKLYGGAGKYIFSLEELTTFDPATSNTYTFTQQALDLPANYKIKCLEELGGNLMAGTWMGTVLSNSLTADIFPWDRVSSSFGQPVSFNEAGVSGMLNDGSTLVVLAGVTGKIYRTDGVGKTLIAQIPNSVMNLDGGKTMFFYPDALMNFKNRIFFGVSSGSTVDGCGIWSLQETSQGTILNLEHRVSSQRYGTGGEIDVTALLKINGDTLISSFYDDLATFNVVIDKTTNTSYTTSYGGYFDSPLYTVGYDGGEDTGNRKFTEAEFQLARPLRTNEGIKISYRFDLTASFTDLITFDYATFGAVVSKNLIFSKPSYDIPACEQIQIRCSLTGSGTSPEFKSLILR